jgi:glycosyltransferase involved in cell wall biosynthesis
MHPELTLLLPYYNEKGWLGPTIDSLVSLRDQRFRLLLIDNASTDSSAEEARSHALPLGERAQHLTVAIPGKIQALAAAQPGIDTPYVAFCDADTIYPNSSPQPPTQLL